jgi:hypothetical protein
MPIAASLEESPQTRTPSETSDNDQNESSSATAAADTNEEPPPTQDGALAESACYEFCESPAEEIPATASAPSGNESSVISTVDDIPFPSIDVAVEETATLGQEDTNASAAYDTEIPDPLTVEETLTPSMEGTEASADLFDAVAEFPQDVEDTANADESTIPNDGDASKREVSTLQA